MARKFFLSILLVVVWAALYLLISGGEAASFSNLFFAPAHPSDAAMPDPWSKQPALVRLFTQADQATRQAVQNLCPVEYRVQSGDTLGLIAQRCGVKVSDLIALNPQVTNPNHIYSGQQLVIYRSGGAESIPNEIVVLHSVHPGDILVINVDGLPPLSDCQIGIGLSTSGFRILTSARTDEQGILNTEVTVPGSTADQAFFLVTTRTLPTVQVVSDTFEILP